MKKNDKTFSLSSFKSILVLVFRSSSSCFSYNYFEKKLVETQISGQFLTTECKTRLTGRVLAFLIHDHVQVNLCSGQVYDQSKVNFRSVVEPLKLVKNTDKTPCLI